MKPETRQVWINLFKDTIYGVTPVDPPVSLLTALSAVRICGACSWVPLRDVISVVQQGSLCWTWATLHD